MWFDVLIKILEGLSTLDANRSTITQFAESCERFGLFDEGWWKSNDYLEPNLILLSIVIPYTISWSDNYCNATCPKDEVTPQGDCLENFMV